MKKATACILLISFALYSKAQDSCHCLTNLDTLIYRVTNNYAGYKDKVNSQTESAYRWLVDSLRQAAGTKPDMVNCFPLLEKFRSFFYDKHLQLRLQGLAAPAAVPATAPPPAVTKWTRQSVTAYLEKNKGRLAPLEGIWYTEGYEIAVLLNTITHNYEGIVLEASNKNWKAGMLKFTCRTKKDGFFSVIYYRGDFVKDTVRMNSFKNFMEVERYGSWKKTFPASADTISATAFTKSHSSFGAFQFRWLNARTVYIALRSCDLSLKPVVDSTLLANKEKLSTVPDWIIDFRGNDGGSTDVFLGLLPWLYTKPLIEKGSSRWMTPDHTREVKKFLTENKDMMDTATTKLLLSLISFGEQHPGGWFRGPADTTRYDSIYKFPKRVAVLSDKNNASSGETFLIDAHGLSDKVTIMGENSAGLLDYGDLLPSALPCNKLALYIPARRANYLDDGVSYDQYGYPPDIKIPAGTKDWIQFVTAYWKRHPATPATKVSAPRRTSK